MRRLGLMLLASTLFVGSLMAAEDNKGIEKEKVLQITAAELAKDKTAGKKEKFTDSMVVIIDDVKNEIEQKKERVKELSKKDKHTEEEKVFLEKIFDRYYVDKGNYEELMEKMIVPPTSLILAQASLESGWGGSSLAKRGNNLFGVKSFNIKEPRVKSEGKVYYRKYDTIRDSVKDYIINLSRHNAYTKLRNGIRKGENSLKLTSYLAKYCEDPQYGKDLTVMIKDNNFVKFDI